MYFFHRPIYNRCPLCIVAQLYTKRKHKIAKKLTKNNNFLWSVDHLRTFIRKCGIKHKKSAPRSSTLIRPPPSAAAAHTGRRTKKEMTLDCRTLLYCRNQGSFLFCLDI